DRGTSERAPSRPALGRRSHGRLAAWLSTRAPKASTPPIAPSSSTKTKPPGRRRATTRRRRRTGSPPIPMFPSRSRTAPHLPAHGSRSNTDRSRMAAPRLRPRRTAPGAVSTPRANTPRRARATTWRRPGYGHRAFDPIDVSKDGELRRPQAELAQAVPLVQPGGARAHRHAQEHLRVRAPQAQGPPAAVEGGAEHGVDAGSGQRR